MKTAANLCTHHTGCIVEDIEKTLEYFVENYPVKNVQRWDFKPMKLKLDGKEVTEDFFLKVVMCTLDDGSLYEFIKPISEFGYHYEFLSECTTSLNHISFLTTDYDYWHKTYEERGFPLFFEAEIEDDVIGYRRCFYAKDTILNLVVEIREKPYFRTKK